MTLQEPYLPSDFDAFWEDTVREAESVALDYQRSAQSAVVRDGFKIDLIDFRGVSGDTVHGWFACDSHVAPAPSFLWLAPYGRWSMPPNEYGTRAGFCSLSFNYFGESAFHEESYRVERGYFAQGLDSAETWVFRRMFQDSLIAARVLDALPETDSDRIGAAGLSQGGGLAIWLGAFCSQVKAVCADLPFGAARPLVFNGNIKRYPLMELLDWWGEDESLREQAMKTMSYFDTVNIATRCSVPTLLTLGLRDPAVKDYEVKSILSVLAGEKEMVELDWGHDWHPSMVERNREWLLKYL